MFLQLTKFGLV